ncbi:MAG: ATP-dependent DNA helicase Rep [Betaproteobacteria bacterium]|nr:ATP-dependent DNA helicase Rep [Betaproteobacteria bacterium]
MSASFNDAQRAAIRHLDGPCLVLAGAGSGKTRVITHKMVHLIESGFAPEAIGAITFTNKAAQEMAERLQKIITLPKGRRPLVSTFHSLGMQILRQDGERLGLKRSFSILDSDDCAGILAGALATTDRKLIRHAQHQISLWKNALLDPDLAADQSSQAAEHAIARAWREHAATLAAYQAVDFDDLILLPVKLLTEHPELAQRWRERLRYLLVDEYQDTNAAQYELLKLLTGPRAAFTAVGDDDQAIYGWRGATLDNLRRLEADFPALKLFKLEQNYRSSLTILGAANRLIANNPKLHEKRLWSEHGMGDAIQVVPCDNEEAEAESVVMRLHAHRFERRAAWRDYAILYRGNHQSRVFEQWLRKENIPYVLSGGQSFFERAEIRDLIAYLRLIANDDDDPAFIRAATTPKRGIGTATLTALGDYAGSRQISMFEALFETGFESRLAARQLQTLREFGEFINRIHWRAAREPAGPVLDDLLAAIDYRGWLTDSQDEKTAATRWRNVCDFCDWVKKRAEEEGATLAQLAQSIAILSQLDRRDAEADAVRLTTIHASKGLEFPHVFVVGCEEGVLPHLGARETEAEAEEGARAEPATDGRGAAEDARIEEERRLMYVAITRAERSLTLSWCRERSRARLSLPQEPSRFIAEMDLSSGASGSRATVSNETARARLGALKDLLGAARTSK